MDSSFRFAKIQVISEIFIIDDDAERRAKKHLTPLASDHAHGIAAVTISPTHLPCGKFDQLLYRSARLHCKP